LGKFIKENNLVTERGILDDDYFDNEFLNKFKKSKE
jgi:hypothetical protein